MVKVKLYLLSWRFGHESENAAFLLSGFGGILWRIERIRGGDFIYMTIKEVSEGLDIPVDTLRYYEKVGVIPSVTRTARGFRNYNKEDIRWIETAKCMRSAGVPIEVLVEYCLLYQEGDATSQERLELLEEQREKLVARKKQMEEALGKLDHLLNLITREKSPKSAMQRSHCKCSRRSR